MAVSAVEGDTGVMDNYTSNDTSNDTSGGDWESAEDESIDIDVTFDEDSDGSNEESWDDVISLDKYPTGNPVLMLLIMFSLIFLPFIGRK